MEGQEELPVGRYILIDRGAKEGSITLQKLGMAGLYAGLEEANFNKYGRKQRPGEEPYGQMHLEMY